MKRYSLVLIIVAVMINFTVSSQDVTVEPKPITPSSGNILQVGLSPDGSHLAVMTMNEQGDTTIEIWDTDNTTQPIKLIPDLTLFNGFNWSPNSQYIAATGSRGNASGTEYALQVFDLSDESEFDGVSYIIAWTSREFGEFVAYEDTGPRPDYAPVWSADSHVIAVNFRDGIHFYDITDCDSNQCNLVYLLPVGYISSFDWRGDTLISLSDKTIQVWDVSSILH